MAYLIQNERCIVAVSAVYAIDWFWNDGCA